MNIGVVMYQTSLTKGQELVALRMTQELRRQGHRSYIITSPYHDNRLVTEYRDIERSVEGYLFSENSEFQVPIIRTGGYVSSWPPRRIMFRDFVGVLRRLFERFRFDAIISHSTLWNGPEEVARYVAWRKMLDAQGLDGNTLVYAHMSHYQPPDPVRYDLVERTFRLTWNSMVFPQIFQTAKFLLCTTPIEESQMVSLGARKEQCLLYPGGVEEEAFKRHWSKDLSSFLDRHSIPRNTKIISYLGTVEERKNPLAVIRLAKMFARSENMHFVIAGHPSNQDRQVMRASIELRNLTYVGELSEEEKIALIKASYLNVLMSRMEALGLTQLEFMYGGVPVVTSAVGGQKWLIRNGVDGFHVNGPDDLEGAARVIETLVADGALREGLAANARERGREFTLTKITSHLSSRLFS